MKMIDFATVKTIALKFTVTGAQKAHIDRLVFELGLLEKQTGILSNEIIEKELSISQLEKTVSHLTTKNKDLQMEINDRDKVIANLKQPKNSVPDGFDAVTKRVAQFMDEHEHVSHEAISSGLGISLADVRYHVGALIAARMVEQPSCGFVSDSGFSQPTYDLLQLGRNYARQ